MKTFHSDETTAAVACWQFEMPGPGLPMPKCKSCGKHVGWFQMLKNPLMLRNWKVLNAYLFETLCLECVASWNTYFEWIRKYQESSRKSE